MLGESVTMCGMVHAPARCRRVGSVPRLVAVMTLASVSVCILPSVADAVVPGAQLWVRRYSGPAKLDDGARAVAVSPDGSAVFVTGSSTGSTGGRDFATIAYDASSGATLWVSRYDGPENEEDAAAALCVSPDGSVLFVTGYSTAETSGTDYSTIAYDAATGATRWMSRYDGPGNGEDVATALQVSNDGSAVFVTGSSTGSTGGLDYATAAYESTTGVKLWTRRYDGPGRGDDFASALGVNPDGSEVFVTGRSTGLTSNDYTTVTYDASTGAKLWTRRYDGPGGRSDTATALGVSPDGLRVFVTGYCVGTTSGRDYATVAYKATTGVKLWGKRYDRPATGDAHIASALGVSPDGSAVFVTGSSSSSRGDGDYATLAYDALTGARLWAKRYDGPWDAGDAIATALGVRPDGSALFVTGFITSPTSGYDYATVAYSASGERLWRTSYHSSSSVADYPADLGVSPDGSTVFVTGDSRDDYATVAYVT